MVIAIIILQEHNLGYLWGASSSFHSIGRSSVWWNDLNYCSWESWHDQRPPEYSLPGYINNYVMHCWRSGLPCKTVLIAGLKDKSLLFSFAVFNVSIHFPFPGLPLDVCKHPFCGSSASLRMMRQSWPSYQLQKRWLHLSTFPFCSHLFPDWVQGRLNRAFRMNS